MTSLLTALLLTVAPARASSGVDGATGVVTVPTTDTVPRGETSGAVGTEAIRQVDGGLVGSLPVGFSYGMGRKVEPKIVLEIGRELGGDKARLGE